MGKDIRHGIDARKPILEGALTLARAVSITYGPHGRTALLDRFAGLLPTKDGVTVAREVQLEGPQALGADILKNACITLNDKCGDGTTTAAIVTATILRAGQKLVVAGAEPRDIIKELEAARDSAIEAIRELSVSAENQQDLEHVARISSNGDEEIARCLAEGAMAVGRDGTISIEDGYGIDTVLEFKDGFECEARLASPYFQDPSGGIKVEGALVAVINKPLEQVEDIVPIMEEASQWPDNPLLIFAHSFSGLVLSIIGMNLKASKVTAYPVLAPGVHVQKPEYLKDIAALAGATFIDSAAGQSVRSWEPGWFGAFRRATIGMKKSLFEGYDERDKQVARNNRLRELDAQERITTSEYDLDRIKERKAKLSDGFVILRVGGITESAMKERRARVEDAFGAVKAALREGLVPGGGVVYLRAAERLSEAAQGTGGAILREALRAPFFLLASNRGENPHDVMHRIGEQKTQWTGWDAMGRTVRDLSQAPKIVDPTAVAVAVLRTAVSVASTLLTVECSITERKQNG